MTKTKKNLFVWLVLIFSVVIVSCSDDDDDLEGKWYRKSDFEGVARGDAASFVIGNKGYVVCGFDKKNRLSDMWEYNIELDFWTQKASFPGAPRSSLVAMNINDKGYVGTGYDGTLYYKDFWEYNPSANTWTQKEDYPGSARYGAVAFGLKDKGYLGCGFDGNYLKDFYSYNPSTDVWEQIISIGGGKRRGASSFIIGDYAYVCCGVNNGGYVDDFWKFDPSTGMWEQLMDISANTTDDVDYNDDYTIVRENATVFVIDDCAYITSGESSSVRSDTWKYYPTKDKWENVAKFKGSARTAACAFSTGERGFVIAGRSGTNCFDDVWELHPYEYDDDDY